MNRSAIDGSARKMEIQNGWLKPATHVVSENCNARPQGEISMLVIHCISLPAGHYGNHYVEQLFTNNLDICCHADFGDLKDVHVASHILISRQGEITQFVPFDKRAWHAGESSFQGRTQCNDFSIGIELEGVDSAGFRDVQYQQLIKVCDVLMQTYSIPAANVVGHSDIAPGRKSDPGTGFDWQRLRQGLADLRVT